jgi:diaminopropionate ammonia-lyase
LSSVTSVFVPTTAAVGPAPVPAALLFADGDFLSVHRYYAGRPDLLPTPLVALPALARSLGLGSLLVKDETGRFGLNAFKLLGARFAVDHLLATGAIRPGDTLVCASEGNHGRAVAHTARLSGCEARVYLARSVAAARADAIAGEGAVVLRVDGTYDDAVRQAAADARAHGWTVVSDTSWEGYEEIPRLIMLGYTRLMDEALESRGPGWRPDAIVVPGGVGGLLAAVATWTARHWGDRRPAVVAVEPTTAACLQASARAGRPTPVDGPHVTIMGGLRCGEVSPLAFQAAQPLVDAYVAIEDRWAEDAMRRFARPLEGDPPIMAGPSGAATLGALLATRNDRAAGEALQRAVPLGRASEVVLIVTEGLTDPDLWRRVVES